MMRRPDISARSGLTLIEIVLATGLLALLMVGVLMMLDSTLSLFRKSETRRNQSELAAGVMELLAADFRSLDASREGDLLVEWVRFDTDGDELKETVYPRLRLVRQASAAEVARLEAPEQAPVPAVEPAEGGAVAPEEQNPALIEVCYCLLPSEEDGGGQLWRGAQLLPRGGGLSFFDPGFFGPGGQPPPGALEEVSGGLLWLGVRLATQTSIVHDGWEPGAQLEHAATSWDAWGRERTDTSVHPWNEPGAGMPSAGDEAILPRRLLLELEFERAEDRRRRTRLTGFVAASDASIEVDDPEELPRTEGAMIRIHGEWMKVGKVTGRRVTVKRGQRGTEPAIHESGARVHFGQGLTREVPVQLYREDWEL